MESTGGGGFTEWHGGHTGGWVIDDGCAGR